MVVARVRPFNSSMPRKTSEASSATIAPPSNNAERFARQLNISRAAMVTVATLVAQPTVSRSRPDAPRLSLVISGRTRVIHASRVAARLTTAPSIAVDASRRADGGWPIHNAATANGR